MDGLILLYVQVGEGQDMIYLGSRWVAGCEWMDRPASLGLANMSNLRPCRGNVCEDMDDY